MLFLTFLKRFLLLAGFQLPIIAYTGKVALENILTPVLTILVVEIVAMMTMTSTKLMAAGANLATTLATFLSFSYLVLYYRSRRKEIGEEIKQTTNYKYEKISTIVKNVLMVSIPMTLSSVLSSINKNVDA